MLATVVFVVVVVIAVVGLPRALAAAWGLLRANLDRRISYISARLAQKCPLAHPRRSR